MTRYILLWLEGPFQAWGHDSKFGLRDTLAFPTKSGVLGIILAASGCGGPQPELLNRLSAMEQTVYSCSRSGILPSRIVDYQVVGNGYNRDGSWEELMIPRNRKGKIPNTGGSKITYRHYIQDGIFAVVAGVPEDVADSIASSLENPIWPLFLGRKDCVPSRLIYRGMYDSKEEVNTVLSDLLKEEGCDLLFHVIEGRHEDDGEVLILHDVPLSFGEEKKYASRYVTVISDRDGRE